VTHRAGLIGGYCLGLGYFGLGVLFIFPMRARKKNTKRCFCSSSQASQNWSSIEELACLNSAYEERGEEQAIEEKHGNHRKRFNPLTLVIHI